MSGGGDGLESASLVRHGSGGRSYTSEGGMLREEEVAVERVTLMEEMNWTMWRVTPLSSRSFTRMPYSRLAQGLSSGFCS